MTTSRTSPDGTTTVKKIMVGGRNYDLPPWITEQEFIDGVTSQRNSEPLSSLVSCKLVEWQHLDHYADEKDFPYFALKFFIPFNSIREVALNRFSLATASENEFMVDTELTSEGVTVTYLGMEPLDLYAVAVYLIPQNLNKVPEFSNNEGLAVSSFIPEREDFEEILDDAANGLAEVYKELVGPDEEPYVLLVLEDMD